MSLYKLKASVTIILKLNYWGEPERAPHKWYSCAQMIHYYIIYYILLWYVGHAKLYPQHGSMNINAKYSIVHSNVWATGRIYAVLI